MVFVPRAMLVACCLLAGCATAPRDAKLYAGPDAVQIQSTRHSTIWNAAWDKQGIYSVNGQPIDTSGNATTWVAPGPQKLVVRRYFGPVFGHAHEGFATLTVHLKPGSHLLVNGKTDGDDIVVWLEDAATHEIEGEQARAPWHELPNDTIVPIFFPRR